MTMEQGGEVGVGIGALAAALAKAQAEFPTIPRDKEVTVQTTKGGTYKFKYAPLDTIIAAVRGPLSANGLAVTQLLDGGDLVTMLLHDSGASLAGRVVLPTGEAIQQFGSAVTYLRRYALQAMLGIAAEEDDDGNAAAGNKATPSRRTAAENLIGRDQPDAAFNPTMAQDPGGLVGTAEIGKSDADFELRQTPTGHKLGFRLVEGRKGLKVIAVDALAEQIAEYRQGIEGFRVTCWGRLTDQTFTPKPKDENDHPKPVTYQVLTLSRLKVGQLELAETLPLFPEAVPA